MSPTPPGERIAALEARLTGLQDGMDELKDDVRACREAIAQANGGMRVLMWIGSTVTLTGLASLAHFIGLLPTLHKP